MCERIKVFCKIPDFKKKNRKKKKCEYCSTVWEKASEALSGEATSAYIELENTA
jgi:hypothetical protein